jgi:putative membrane protein
LRFRFVVLLVACGVLWNVSPAFAGDVQQIDRQLLAGVKQAGLWEGPMSKLAAERGTTGRIRDVAARISDDLTQLDTRVRALAAQLALDLPDTATPDQQVWTGEITAARGADLDRVYVNRVRAAYGSLFGLASQVRASTRDDEVRAFAQAAVDMFLRHMTLLESTGVAETTSLMVVPDGGNSVGFGGVALGGALAGLTAALTFWLVRLLGSPGKFGAPVEAGSPSKK